jgi:hypothetical protein
MPAAPHYLPPKRYAPNMLCPYPSLFYLAHILFRIKSLSAVFLTAAFVTTFSSIERSDLSQHNASTILTADVYNNY